METIRFEEGQSYYRDWALGRKTFTIAHRTARMVTLSNGKKYRIHETTLANEPHTLQEYINVSMCSTTVSLYAENIVKE